MRLDVTLEALGSDEWLANTPAKLTWRLNDGPVHKRQSPGDYRPANAFFNHLQHAPVAGATLPDLVRWNDISLWQFLPSYIAPSVIRTIDLAIALTRIVEETAATSITAQEVDDDTQSIWFGLLQAVARARRCPLHLRRIPLAARRLRGWARQRGIGRAIHRARMNRTLQRLSVLAQGQSLDRGARTLLLVTRPRDWVADPARPGREHDAEYSPLLPVLRAAGWARVIGIECPYGSPALLESRFKSRITARSDETVWRPFWLPLNRDVYRAAQSRFVDLGRELRNRPEFHAALTFRGVPLAAALGRELSRAFSEILPDIAQHLDVAGRILDEESPSAVLATYETGPFARAIIIEAARRGIPSVGLQHGTIFDNHYDYMHEGISPGRSGGTFTVPDVTCVWGSAWRDTLVGAGHYPPESVSVTGNWRYDDLATQLAAIDLCELRHRLGIPTGIGVAAILSSGQGTVEYVAASLDAVQSRPDLVPVIRLHPSDNPQPLRAELRRRGLPDTVMPRIELLELLVLSRVVISQWSTVVAEAALAGRPTVLVNLLHLPGAESYVDAGICIPVDEAAGIAPALTRVLDDPDMAARLDDARAAFVQRFFHHADGRAAERVAAVLEGLLAKRQREPSASAHVGD